MNTDMKTFEMQDRRVVLSTLWTFLTANYIYCDVLSHMEPGALKELITGTLGSIQVTQGFLLTAAIMMEIPFAMIILARVLKATNKVDYRKVAQFLDVDRSGITLATPDEVLSSLGCTYGNVSPIDPNGWAIVFVDSDLSDLSSVYCGAGADGKTLEMRYSDLIRAANAQPLDLARR